MKKSGGEETMCGRYKMSTSSAAIMDVFGVADGYQPPARFNVAPTDPVPVIVAVDGKRRLQPMRWGLIPFWAKDKSIGARMINARIETVATKSAFKESLAMRRCLVVSDGYYEWLSEGKIKQPHLVCFEDRRVFAYAGLWARWQDREADATIESCTIITVPANVTASHVHDRMPLIVDSVSDAALLRSWLDPAVSSIDLTALQVPRELPGLVCFPVDKRVGNVKNDDPSLAAPATSSTGQPSLF